MAERKEPMFKEAVDKIKGLSSFSNLPAEEIVYFGEQIGKKLAKPLGLKTSQIRKFFDKLKSIQTEVSKENFQKFHDEIILLKPKLAYAAGRQNQVKHLMEVIDPAISKIKNYEDFLRFVQFVETIVAYHKYEGGGD